MKQHVSAPSPSYWTYAQPFLVGGFTGSLATTILHPIDITKVRIQITSEILGKAKGSNHISPIEAARQIIKEGGFRSLYKGLDAAVLRQVLYTTTRMGVYTTLFQYIKEKEGSVSTGKKIASALTAGFLGSLIGNPADVALVRMQADPTLPVIERRNYKNAFNALRRIVKEEGVLTLWKGSSPTIVRGMAINLGMLAPYDEIRERLNATKGTVDSVGTRLTAAASAGLLASILSLPFDNVKTKLQKMKPEGHGSITYKGLTDCFIKTVRREGVFRLWVGFLPFYSRTAPHVMLTLLIQDLFNTWSRNRAAARL